MKIVIISHWSDVGERPEFWHVLVKDLQQSQVRLIPISSGSPLNEQWFWDEWDSRDNIEELDYWLYLYRRWRYHREDPNHLYDRWSHEVRVVLQRIVGHDEVVAIIVFPCSEGEYRSYLEDLEYVLNKLANVVVVQFRAGASQQLFANRTRFARVLLYPDDRQNFLRFLQPFVYDNNYGPEHKMPAAPIPVVKPCPTIAVPATPSSVVNIYPTMIGLETSHSSNHYIYPIELLDEVHLGIATPSTISPRQSFVAGTYCASM